MTISYIEEVSDFRFEELPKSDALWFRPGVGAQCPQKAFLAEKDVSFPVDDFNDGGFPFLPMRFLPDLFQEPLPWKARISDSAWGQVDIVLEVKPDDARSIAWTSMVIEWLANISKWPEKRIRFSGFPLAPVPTGVFPDCSREDMLAWGPFTSDPELEEFCSHVDAFLLESVEQCLEAVGVQGADAVAGVLDSRPLELDSAGRPIAGGYSLSLPDSFFELLARTFVIPVYALLDLGEESFGCGWTGRSYTCNQLGIKVDEFLSVLGRG